MRSLLTDTGGSAAVYVALTAATLVGVTALVVDGGRVMNLHTELQAAADSLALAGAAELDRRSDALTRAQRAINTLVANRQTLDAGGSTVAVATVRFFSDLPADTSPLTAAFETTDPKQAHFVEVKVETRTMGTLFAQAVNWQAATATAQAVAGFDDTVCNFMPLFMCNPFEGSGMTLEDVINDPDIRRRQIQMTSLAAGSWFPGGFGYLEAPTGPGASALGDALSMVKPPACYSGSSVDVKPGAMASMRHAMNVRFDMYEGSYNGKKNNPSYRPALNVTKGYVGASACNKNPAAPPVASGLPRDDCFATSSCPYMGGRMGDGQWDFDGYWAVNHPSVSAPNGWSNLTPNLPSRYEVYRWEIDNGAIPNNGGGGENGNPECYSGGTLSDTPDRRVLYGAAIDCGSLGLAGAATGVPVTAFVKMFITEPMPVPPDESLYVEMISIIKPGTDDDIVRDTVQLYR